MPEKESTWERIRIWIAAGVLALSILGFNFKDLFSASGRDAALEVRVQQLEATTAQLQRDKASRETINAQLADFTQRLNMLQEMERQNTLRLEELLGRR